MIKITFYRPRIFTREFWRHWKQRRKQGFIDEDTYNLYSPIAEFVLPRLRCFRKHAFGNRVTENDDYGPIESRDGIHISTWCQIVDRMIWSLNEIVENDSTFPEKEPPDFSEQGMIDAARERKIYYAKLQEGLTLFGKHFQGLWW